MTFEHVPQVLIACLELAEEIGRVCKYIWRDGPCHLHDQLTLKLVKSKSELCRKPTARLHPLSVKNGVHAHENLIDGRSLVLSRQRVLGIPRERGLHCVSVTASLINQFLEVRECGYVGLRCFIILLSVRESPLQTFKIIIELLTGGSSLLREAAKHDVRHGCLQEPRIRGSS